VLQLQLLRNACAAFYRLEQKAWCLSSIISGASQALLEKASQGNDFV
jgi:hypothetical protein